VFEDDTGSILEDAKHIVLEVLEQTATSSSMDWASVETDIGRRLKKFFQNVIERRPLIIPTIIQV
jgi:ribonuclease J